MSTSGKLATGSSFGAGEARDAGLCGFMGQVINVLAVLPAGHALVVMPPSILLTHAVRIADEQRSYPPLNAKVDDLPRSFVTDIPDTPLRSSADLVLGALQLLPTARVFLAPALLFGE